MTDNTDPLDREYVIAALADERLVDLRSRLDATRSMMAEFQKRRRQRKGRIGLRYLITARRILADYDLPALRGVLDRVIADVERMPSAFLDVIRFE